MQFKKTGQVMDIQPKFGISSAKIIDRNGQKIVSYESQDFRVYWQSPSKSILNHVEQSRIRQMIPEPRGWFVDIGCGFGRNAQAYYNNNANFVLVDYSLKHLSAAQQQCHDLANVFYIAADANNLPFRDGVFDNGVCIRLLHHLNTPGLFLNNTNRIMAAGSKLVITYINRRNLFRILRYGASSFKKEHSELSTMIYGTHPHYFKQLATDAGFRIGATAGTGFLHQLSHYFNRVNVFVEQHNDTHGMRFFHSIEKLFSSVLGKLDLSLVQFSLLLKDTAIPAQERAVTSNLSDILKCVRCNRLDLEDHSDHYQCKYCLSKFPSERGIIDFRTT